jgi:GNAT superfamily N-acetyltransferase
LSAVSAVRLDENDAHDDALHVIGYAWPEFMHHDPVANRHWGSLYRTHRATQTALVRDGEPVAAVHAIPIRWDGTHADLPDRGWDEGLQRAVDQHAAGTEPNTLCALAITIRPDCRGQGLAPRAVAELRAIAGDHSFGAVIACVRPNRKADYPLAPFDRYVRWTDEAGEPFDPWMRVHARAGATIEKPCEVAMEIPGTVAQWEEWAAMRFPESGDYVVPGALVPVRVDVESDRVVYQEPNVWMVHEL